MVDLVSIITPAYRAAKYLDKAITSVQQQTYRHWELIVTDDCSPDETREVVARYAERDQRVKLIAQSTNQGPAMARNASLRQAQGRFIAFLDSDDWWLSTKLERQLDFMRRSGAALSYTQFRRVDQDGDNEGRLIKVPDRLTYRMLLGNTAIATSTAMVDRKQTGDFRMTKTYYDDFALWLKLLRAGHVANALQEDLMRYRVLKGSVSRSKVNSAKKVWSTYREIEGLSIASSSIYFSLYTCNALLKYVRF
ncbi:glycosyltransferase family 2 protein [Bradyrhizobium sp. 2TAF36]|uniref:glycosyltransferase family 2 protein n=1 Tax=Bradyrhizobium sp. 2TAF36 TaxID=3233016 RepID=UPI003F9211C6